MDKVCVEKTKHLNEPAGAERKKEVRCSASVRSRSTLKALDCLLYKSEVCGEHQEAALTLIQRKWHGAGGVSTGWREIQSAVNVTYIKFLMSAILHG